MSTTYSLTKEGQTAAASEFGRMLRRWRTINGWTQYTARRWAEEAGLDDVVRHSGLSELERGLTKSPRNVVFLSLANLNLLIAEQQFTGVHSRDLLDQLKGSKAICDQDGKPWGPLEFWGCHAGILLPVAWLAPPATTPAPVLTIEQAVDLCASWSSQVIEAAKAAGASPADLISIGGFARPLRLRQKWLAVAMGLEVMTPVELESLWDVDTSEWLPAQWLEAWRQTLPLAAAGGGVSSDPVPA